MTQCNVSITLRTAGPKWLSVRGLPFEFRADCFRGLPGRRRGVTALQPYPAYGDSGVEWLGKVPTHWRTVRAKRLFRKMDRPVRPDDEVVTCFRDGTVTLRRNRRELSFTESLKEIGYQGVRRGDLVIHAMDAFAGACGVADSDGKSTPVYAVCAPKDESANSRYYAFCVREMARSRWILALSRGVRERSTDFRFATFGNQWVPVPPSREQATIVRFLDHTDRRIRRYIRAKERLIELLEEQKQAVIHQAVTGQIDARTGEPYPGYKDSGVEWLGEVPEPWAKRRLKSLLRAVDQRSSTGDEILLSLRRDHGVVVYSDHFARPPQGRTLVGFKLVAAGQLVVNRLQANNGLVFRSSVDGLVSPDYSVFEHKIPLRMQYVSDLLRTSVYRSHFRRVARGLGTGTAGFLRLYDDALLATTVFLPPEHEQDLILRSLADGTTAIEEAMNRQRVQAQLGDEFRRRLNADVLTGKLDVREAAAALRDIDARVAEGTLKDTTKPAAERKASHP